MGDFKAADSLIGCRPFVLDKHEPGVKATFVRSPDYYAKGLPYLDRVEWLFLKRPGHPALPLPLGADRDPLL